ncbi:MAG: hypothetical protein H6Q20_1164 [Bacteroidetes bacterium]|jgi:hypothetical protein|nr:hypothetical protein [Bacteroidota bacterium]
MCSFYNPNIQAEFEADERKYIHLSNLTLAVYKIVFKLSDGCHVVDKDDLRAVYQLDFVRFVDKWKQINLSLVDKSFAELLAAISLEVLAGRVKSFEDYVLLKLSMETETDRNNALYTGDKIQDYIELLIYSDIAENKPSRGVRDFTRIFKTEKKNKLELTNYYTLYERLKLYAWLRKEMVLEIDREKIQLKDREVILQLKIRV